MTDSVHAQAHNIKMLNDIARNIGAGKSEEQAVNAIVAHVRKFWSPVMIEGLLSALPEQQASLAPQALAATQILADK